MFSISSNSNAIISIPQTINSSGIEDNPTVFYQLIRGSTDQTNKYDTFYIQQRVSDGWTYADVKVNHPLDYERIKEYNLTLRVEVKQNNVLFFYLIFLLLWFWNIFNGM